MSSISSPTRPRSAKSARRCSTRRACGRSEKRQRRLTRKARKARRQLLRNYQLLPTPARSFFDSLTGAFTAPTFLRFVSLALAAILTVGCRTVSNLLRTLGALAPGHFSSYHRVFSKRRWSSWSLARRLAGWVFDRLATGERIFLAGDDTVDEHPGDEVFGKGCHRDPVRSTH